MIILKLFGVILYALLKLISFLLLIGLTIFEAFFMFAGKTVEKIGGIIGFLWTVATFACLATGQVAGAEFWKMLLVGVAFGAIPTVFLMLGEEGIYSVKMILRRI